jgi:phage replication-related protein YjqB (UPF0714/DUF867 family)
LSKYACFADLQRHEVLGRDFTVMCVERIGSSVAIVAPHGGKIEEGTSEIATLIAGTEHSLFCFEGLKPHGLNRHLHITSHHFDHPDCLALMARHERVLSVHGCMGHSQIFLGGLDPELTRRVGDRLSAAGFEVIREGHRYPGRHPLNICNRGARGRGAQLEITHDLRVFAHRARIADAVRAALAESP